MLCLSIVPIYFVFNQQTDISKLFYSLFNISTPLNATVVRSVCVCVCVCVCACVCVYVRMRSAWLYIYMHCQALR